MRCAIHSAEHGSLMVIPREKKLVRLYIQLKEVTPDATGRADRSKIKPETILSAAQKILSPYKVSNHSQRTVQGAPKRNPLTNPCSSTMNTATGGLRIRYVKALSPKRCNLSLRCPRLLLVLLANTTKIGQRVGDTFDVDERVFLAGDAVHTHSPKAGQGMNVSMQDSFNLGWKIALAAKKISPRSILKTYQSERRRIAKDLIEFDHRFSRLFSGRPAKDVMDEEGVSMEVFKDAFVKGNLFASGLSVDYGPSNIVYKAGDPMALSDGKKVVEWPGVKFTEDSFAKKQALATGLPVGKRFASFKVLNQSCARPWEFQQRLKADGRFRVVLFAGKILDPEQKKRVNEFAAKLDAPNSFLRRATPEGAKIDSVIEVLTIHSSKRTDTELLTDFPDILHPFDEHTGWDYDKVYVDDESYHEGFAEAYKNYGVDPQRGAVVAVRPDQYVGYVGELEDFDELEKYFEGCLILKPVSNGTAA